MRALEEAISSEVFDQMQIHTQYKVVREFGQALSVRVRFQYLIMVYSLFDYYVAVWREVDRTGIHDIHVIDPMTSEDQWFFPGSDLES